MPWLLLEAPSGALHDQAASAAAALFGGAFVAEFASVEAPFDGQAMALDLGGGAPPLAVRRGQYARLGLARNASAAVAQAFLPPFDDVPALVEAGGVGAGSGALINFEAGSRNAGPQGLAVAPPPGSPLADVPATLALSAWMAGVATAGGALAPAWRAAPLGVPVLLRTADERTVHAVWIEYRSPGAKLPDRAHSATDEGPCATPVALCLHANAMVLDDMIDWAQFYLTRGISVMLVTFWGYPDPDEPEADGRASPPTAAPDVERVKQLPREMEAAYSADVGMRCPSEQTMYHDAEAALRWLMDTRGATIDRTLVHGLSIGGGVAASLGVNHPGLRVTFDQTFASLAEVTLHVGTGLYEQIVLPRAPRRCHTLVRWLRPCVLRLVAFVLLRMLFKTGSSSSRIGEQDRMDNVRKAAAIKADVFAIFAEQDEMMPPTIAHRLLVARYGASAAPDMIHSRQLCVPGGHCAFFADTPEHAHKYTQVRTYPLTPVLPAARRDTHRRF
jgi:dienelactone hydrolase